MNDSKSRDSEIRLLTEIRSELSTISRDRKDRIRHTVLNSTLHGQSKSRNTKLRSRKLLVPIITGVTAMAAIGGLAIAKTASFQEQPGRTSFDQANAIGANTDARQVMYLAASTISTEKPPPIEPGKLVYCKTNGSVTTFVMDKKTYYLNSDFIDERWMEAEGMILKSLHQIESINSRYLTESDKKIAESIGGSLEEPTVSNMPDPTNPADDMEERSIADKKRLQEEGPSFDFPTSDFLAKLPNDPQALLQIIKEHIKKERGSQGAEVTNKDIFRFILEFFEKNDAIYTPQFRANLYRAVGEIPGVERVKGQVNFEGRKGIAIAYSQNGRREEMILDSTTLQVIGSRNVFLGPEEAGPYPEQVPPGTVMSFTATQCHIVDKVGETR